MAEVSQGSLTWPLENETRWVAVEDGHRAHRLLLHAKLGFIFDEHSLSTPELLSIEGRMAPIERQCGCHVLARWFTRELTWESGFVLPDTTTKMLVAQINALKNGVRYFCRIQGQAIDIVFLSRIIEATGNGNKLQWYKKR